MFKVKRYISAILVKLIKATKTVCAMNAFDAAFSYECIDAKNSTFVKMSLM